MISKSYLQRNYIRDHKSVSEIAKSLKCSQSKINYWLGKHKIQKRTISDAVYLKNNPNGDPFSKPLLAQENMFLYGLGLGLYWGEGNKANKHAVRLGNTDPDLVKMFLMFLEQIYNIDTKKLRFGLQIFSDCSADESIKFWSTQLSVHKDKFYKVIITKSSKSGTYTNKNFHGVLTVYFSNVKLRDMIISAIDDLRINQKPT